MSRRDSLRVAVAALEPVDERERRAQATLLAALDQLPRPFDRDADPTHVTASSVVVGSRGTVLHLHKRLGCWLQPGGHVDRDEDPADAAIRETAEETGLDARHPPDGPLLLHVDVHPAAGGHIHLDLRYLLEAPDEDPSPAEGESREARWFGWDAALEIADTALRGALIKARAFRAGR